MTNSHKNGIALCIRKGVEAGINSLNSAQLSELVLAPYLDLQSEYLSRLELSAA